ncbi:flagellar motor protein MotS [Oceanobacillus sp. CAU 1775]
MKRRRIRKANDSGAPSWMVTYSDMVTLILVFFILLFSMSQISQNKFEMVTESFQNRGIFDFYPSIVPLDTPSSVDTEDDEDFFSFPLDRENEARDEEILNSLMTEVETFLEENDLNEVISANRTEEGVELILQDYLFFNPGEAEILDEGLPFLIKIGRLLSTIENDIVIEGHTDNRPMSSFVYPSNWELSGARASTIVRYFIDEQRLNEARFRIAGYGETKPIAPNDSAENMAQNRRVEIVILKE